MFSITRKEPDMHDDATSSVPEPAKDAPAGATPGRRRIIKLTDEQRQYVVRRLAADDLPSDVAKDMQRRFGIAITRQAIEYYDPTRRGKQTGQKWARRFAAARGSFQAAQPAKPITLNRIEKLIMQTIEMIADRIYKGVDAEGRKMLAKRPQDITDNDRLRALAAFMRRIKETDPAGYAEIRSVLLDEPELRAADVAPASPAVHESPAVQDPHGEGHHGG
jgi:hypothetical protein